MGCDNFGDGDLSVDEGVGVKPGRNDPCPCGSGKKYKKCHLLQESRTTRAIPAEVIEHFKNVEVERLALEGIGIFINYVKPILFGEHKVWALGNQIVSSKNKKQTFHDFIEHVLVDTLGREWWQAQSELPSEEQHFIVRCSAALAAWKRDHAATATEVSPGVMQTELDGLGLYLLSLAFDVATLRHALTLPTDLVDRLKHSDQFQGARYELAVAAIFARIDCDVRFLEDTTRKHPEFIARFRPTGTEVAVEAKSRHRAGVLHMTGGFDEERAAKGDVRRHLHEALEQDPGDMPFMIFVDINSPPTPGQQLFDSKWFDDVRNLLDTYEAPTPDKPDPFTALAFTNYSHHYQAGVVASGFGHVTVWPAYVRNEVDALLRDRLQVAIAKYGRVPDLDAEMTV